MQIQDTQRWLVLLVVLGLTASLFAADDDDNKSAGRVKSAVSNAPNTFATRAPDLA